MMNIRYAIAAAAAAGALTLAGCSGAAAPSAVTARATVKAATSTSALTRITVYSVNSDGPVLSAIVSGPVLGDYGPALQVAPGSTVPARHAADLLLNLAHGTFRLYIKDMDTKFGETLAPVNAHLPRTCSDYLSVSGNLPIVPGSGTGAYRGVAGTFDATMTVDEVHPSPCTTTVTLFRQLIWINGAGKITLR